MRRHKRNENPAREVEIKRERHTPSHIHTVPFKQTSQYINNTLDLEGIQFKS
jgi:hypothetical protein